MSELQSSRVSLGSSLPSTAFQLPPITNAPGKRALDVILASIGLILSSPFWLICAVAIKLDDGGPIFYQQERWGRNGQKFRIRNLRDHVC